MTSPAACCSNKRSAKKANFELLSRSRGRKGVGKQTSGACVRGKLVCRRGVWPATALVGVTRRWNGNGYSTIHAGTPSCERAICNGARCSGARTGCLRVECDPIMPFRA